MSKRFCHAAMAFGENPLIDSGERSLIGIYYAFMEENRDADSGSNRDVPEHWPDNEADLGFVCPLPSQLIPAMQA